MKNQWIIFLFALWGLIAVPLGYFNEFLEDYNIQIIWLQLPLAVILMVIVWGWYAPALCVTKILGIFDLIYELEIGVHPQNLIGWLLPVVCWYLIFNLVLLRKNRNRNSDQTTETIR